MSEVTLPAKVDLTPEVLAETFGKWGSNLQALFFARMAEYMEGWGPMNVQKQMLAIGSALGRREDHAVIREMLADIHAGIIEAE